MSCGKPIHNILKTISFPVDESYQSRFIFLFLEQILALRALADSCVYVGLCFKEEFVLTQKIILHWNNSPFTNA